MSGPIKQVHAFETDQDNTDFQQIPVVGEAEPEAEAAVVSPKPENQTLNPIPDPGVRRDYVSALDRYIAGRGDVDNPGGFRRVALKERWTLPRWAWTAPQEAAGRTQEAQEGRVAPGTGQGPQKADAAYFARLRAETMGWVGMLDCRPWTEIRKGLTAEQLRYCEEEL